jgi:acyl-CoA dehydrogenase
VASAILKVHLTEAGRRAVNHGMDILGGKGIIQGPSNLLGVAYRGMRPSPSPWRAPTSSRAR